MSVLDASKSGPQVKRPLAYFPPSIWGDYFLDYNFDDKEFARKQQEVEKFKEEVRKELLQSEDNPMQQLNLIDEIKRLGVACHFQDEIKEALERLDAAYYSSDDDDNLYSVALCFRLLRQADYNISPERFNKFKDDNGNFKECLTADVRGMLSLYDASQLRIRGEEILDDALAFTTTQLSKSLETGTISNTPLAAQVSHALKQQMRKNLPILEAKHYMIYVYPDMASNNKALLKLAKLEFNLMQSVYRKELSILQRYWKDLGLAAKSTFARDRLVECFLWAVVPCPEPEDCLSRSIITKFIAILTVIDDIYDAFGLVDELNLFTEAFERWDMKCMKQLPDYMRPAYKAYLDLSVEIEDEMAKQGRTYQVPYAIEAMKNIIRAYMKEAKWFSEKYIPTVDEHGELGVITSASFTVLTLACLGMDDDVVKKETFDLLCTKPKFAEASGIVVRFMGDIVSYKFEQQRGHPATAVECYVNQYGATKEEAQEACNELVVNAWKDLNEEFLKKETPKKILEVAVGYARVADILYKVEDSFSLNKKATIDVIISLLIDPAPEN